jgi:hypothetical protein
VQNDMDTNVPNLNPVPVVNNSPGTKIKKLQSIVSIVVFVLFISSLVVGAYAGYTAGQSRATYENVLNINKALKYYYADQDIYPSQEQYLNQKILVPYYLREMPRPVGSGGSCSKYQNFDYSQSTSKKFALQFCLNKSTDGIPAGVHVLNEQGLQ